MPGWRAMKRFTSSARRASLPAPPVAGHTAASAIRPPARNAATGNSAPAWPASSRRRKADPQAIRPHLTDQSAGMGGLPGDWTLRHFARKEEATRAKNSVGYLERLVVLTAPERGAGIPLRGISGDPGRLNGCDRTAAPHGSYAVAARRCSVIVVPLQETTMMVARKNQAVLDKAM